MNASLQILLCIAVVIVAAKLAGALSARVGLPLVLGELLAGVLLGPTLINIWGISWLASPSTVGAISVATVFKVLADVGVVLLMFVAGLETDLKLMRAAVAPAFWAAMGGVILPMAGGYLLAKRFGFSDSEAIFIGTILTATSVTITAQTLMNLNRLQSKAGSTILGAAVIDDVLGLIVLSLVIALAPQVAHTGATGWRGLAMTVGKMTLCLALIGILGPVLTRWVMKQSARLHGHHTEVAAALVMALLLAFQAEWLGGMAAITGSYLAGLFVAATPSQSKVSQDLHPMINAFFGPLFFVSIGLQVNAWQLGGRLGFLSLLLLIAIAGKIVGSGLGAYFTGFSRRDSLVVGVGMIPRGEVGLITASLGLAAGLVSQEIYGQAVALVLVTTLITPGLLRYAFPKTAPPQVAAINETGVVEIQDLNGLSGPVANGADA